MRDQLSLSHDPGYLLPNFLPAKAGIAGITSVTNKAMSYSRFVRLSRTLLQMPPMRLTPEEAMKYSSYDARR
eukprot:1637816-Karenia_brevis.AAC.1